MTDSPASISQSAPARDRFVAIGTRRHGLLWLALMCLSAGCGPGDGRWRGGTALGGATVEGSGGKTYPGGGAGGRGGFGPPAPSAPTLSISPLDGRTNTADQPISVTLNDGGGQVDATGLQALAARISLVTWPERGAVPFDRSITPPLGAAATQRVITLTPRGALANRWYAVLLGDLPPPLSYHPIVPGNLQEGTRFRPLSAPRVLLVEVCDIEEPARLNVAFSEPLAAPASAPDAVAVIIDGAPATCAVVRTDEGSVGLTCPGLTGTSHVTVSLAAGVSSKTGLPVPPASFDFDVATLPQAALCRWLVAPVP